MADAYRKGKMHEGMFQKHLVKVDAERAVLVRQVDAARQGIDAAAHFRVELDSILDAVALLKKKLMKADQSERRALAEAVLTGEAGHCVKLGSKGSIEMKLLIAAEPQRLSALRAN
jgi:hypothetical protein